MSEPEKQEETPTPHTKPQLSLPTSTPETIPTLRLLNPDPSGNISNLMKNDSEIMKAYDLNEENLKNLKQLRKYFVLI